MSLISHLENLVSTYTSPSTYQNLIRTNSSQYNWKNYIKYTQPSYADAIKSSNTGLFNALLKLEEPKPLDLQLIIEYDNLKFLRSILKKYPKLATFEILLEAVEYKSPKSLRFLLRTFNIDNRQYMELLVKIIEFDDLNFLKLVHKILPLSDDDLIPLLNLAKIFKYRGIVKYLSKLEAQYF